MGIEPRSLIQLSETLPIELTGTHICTFLISYFMKFYKSIVYLKQNKVLSFPENNNNNNNDYKKKKKKELGP